MTKTKPLIIFLILLFFYQCASREKDAFLYNINIFQISKDLIKPFQVTIDVSREFYPTVSVKDNYIVYVSDKTGNLDLWLYDVKTRQNFRLTYHSSDDTMPRFSPDGEKLVFTSFRSDSTGDLWYLDIDEIKDRIGSRLDKDEIIEFLRDDMAREMVLSPYPETEVSFTPDSKFIFFVREEANALKNIFIQRAKKGKPQTKITYSGALSPSCSPDGRSLVYINISKDREQKGHLFLMDLNTRQSKQLTFGDSVESSPSFINSGQIIFCKAWMDLNKDRSIDLEDNSSLFLYDLKKESEKQLTSGKFYNANPVSAPFHKGVIIFASTRQDNVDIWMLPKGGIIPDLPDADEQLHFADRLNDDLDKIASYNRFLYNFPDHENTGQAYLGMARSLASLGFKKKSDDYLENILMDQNNAQAGALHGIYLESKIQLIINKKGHTENSIKEILTLKSPGLSRSDLVSIHRAVGDIYFHLKKFSRAIQYYEKAEQDTQDPFTQKEIRGSLVSIYSFLNQKDSLEKELKQLSSSTNHKDKLKIQEKYFSSYFMAIPDLKKEEHYKRLIEKFKIDQDLYLNTLLHYAAFLKKVKRFTQAKKILETIINQDKTPHLFFKATAFSSLSDLESDGDKESLLWRSFQTEIKAPFQEEKDKIRLKLLSFLLDQAQKYFNDKNYLKAKDYYSSVLKIDDLNLPALTGMIKCDFNLIPPSEESGNKILNPYKKLSLDHPENYIYHYVLGYGYSLLYAHYFQMYLAEKEKGADLYFPKSQCEKYFKLSEEKLQLVYRIKPDLVSSYLTLGWLYQLHDDLKISDRSLLEDAIPYFHSALHYNDEKKQPYTESMLCLNLANIFLKLGNFSSAFQYYRNKLDLSGEFQSPLQEGFFYYHSGYCAYFIEKDQQARQSFKKAYQTFLKAGEKLYALRSLIYLAMTDRLVDQYEAAITNYNQAIFFIQDHHLDVNPERLYREIGICYQNLNKHNEALHYFFLAEKIIPKDPEKGFWDRPFVRLWFMDYFSVPVWPIKLTLGASFAYQGFSNRDEQKLLYSLISDTYFLFLNYKDSLNFLHKKRILLEEDKNIDALPNVYNQLGLIYFKLNEFKNAEDYFRLSNEKNKGRKKKADDRGIIINNLNLVEIIIKRYKNINRYLEEIKGLLDESALLAQKKGNESFLVDIYSLYGMIYFKLGENKNLKKKTNLSVPRIVAKIKNDYSDYSRSLNYYKKAYDLALLKKLKERMTKLKFNMGLVYLKTFDNKKASGIFEEAQRDAEKYFLKGIEWKSKYLLSRIRGDLAERSDDIFNIIEGYPKGFDYSINDDPLIKSVFDDMITYHIKSNNFRMAVELMERYRNFKIRQIFNSYPLTFTGEDKLIYDEFKKQEQVILDKINDSKKILIHNYNVKTLFDLKAQINTLLQERDNLAEKRKKAKPEFIYYLYKNIIPVDQIQKTLSKRQALVQFYLTDDKIYIALLDKNDLWFFSREYKKSDLVSLVQEYNRSLAERDDDYTVYQDRLSALLFEDMEETLEDYDLLAIIPDSILYKIPFHLLLPGKSLSCDLSLAQYYFNRSKPSYLSKKMLITTADSSLNKISVSPPVPDRALSLNEFINDRDVGIVPDGLTIQAASPLFFSVNYNEKYYLDSPDLPSARVIPPVLSVERLNGVTLWDEDNLIGTLCLLYHSGASTVFLPRWNVKEKYYFDFWDSITAVTEENFNQRTRDIAERIKIKEPHPFYYAYRSIFGALPSYKKITPLPVVSKKDPEEDALRLISQAGSHYRTNNFEMSIDLYRQAFDLLSSLSNERDNRARVVRGIIDSYTNLKEYRDALSWAEKARTYSKQFERDLFYLNYKLENYDRALVFMTNVTEEDPDDYIRKARVITLADIDLQKKLDLLDQTLGGFKKASYKKREFSDITIDFFIDNDKFTNAYTVLNLAKNYRGRYHDNGLSLTDIQSRMGKYDLFIDTYYSQKYTLFFLVTKTNSRWHYLKSPDVYRMVEELSNNMRLAEQEDLIDNLYDIHKSLFNNIDPATYSNVFIFPDGPLYKIPFQALYNGEHYLIETHPVLTLASYEGLVPVRAKKPSAFRIFATGYQINLPGRVISDFSFKEAEEIDFLFPQSVISINDLQSPDKKDYTVYHISLKTASSNGLTFLYNPLWKNKKTRLKNFLPEKNRLDLLFFSENESIKQSNLDKFILDMSGYSQYCIYNLFRQNDTSCALFVRNFYRSLKQDGSFDQAFLYASRMMKEKYPHPLFWGNFILIRN
ncbi:MAG: PD40 domain-containing protein [Spirochaetes bacterium]|nr:PD40 domain-containing protein [Spirochaetota bacterium]